MWRNTTSVWAAAVALAVAAVAAACASAEEKAKEYRRIIAFSPAVTEIIYRLGAQDRLVGIASFSDFPPEAVKEKPAVGGILNIDSEKILSLEPDLIISPPGAIAGEKLPQFAAEVKFLPDKTLADVELSFVEIGRLVGKPTEGKTLSDSLQSAVAAAKKESVGRPGVAVLLVIGYEPLWVAGGYGFLNELVEAAGGTNAAGGVKKDFYGIDFEGVLAAKPDVIVDLTLEGDLAGPRRDAALTFWKRFPTIPAAANGRVEFIDSDLLTIPGPRLIEGLRALQEALGGGAGPKREGAREEEPNRGAR